MFYTDIYVYMEQEKTPPHFISDPKTLTVRILMLLLNKSDEFINVYYV